MLLCAEKLEDESVRNAAPIEGAAAASSAAILFAMVGELDRAERLLAFALHRQPLNLQSKARTVTEIRWAQVHQLKERRGDALALLQCVVERCRADEQLRPLLDFALQHLGKLQFELQDFANALISLGEALTLRRHKGEQSLVDSTLLAIEVVSRTQALDKTGP